MPSEVRLRELRDEIAIAAMNALIQGNLMNEQFQLSTNSPVKDIVEPCKYAYRIADAMVVARNLSTA